MRISEKFGVGSSKLKVLLLLAFSLLVGCKSQKMQMKEAVESQQSAVVQTEEQQDSASVVQVRERVSTNQSANEATKVTETTIVWSEPREKTGEQYAEKTTVRVIESINREENTTHYIRDSTASHQNKSERVEKADYKSVQNTNTENMTKTKVRTHKILYWLIGLALILVILILRRCGALKLF